VIAAATRTIQVQDLVFGGGRVLKVKCYHSDSSWLGLGMAIFGLETCEDGLMSHMPLYWTVFDVLILHNVRKCIVRTMLTSCNALGANISKGCARVLQNKVPFCSWRLRFLVL
jgi:hypothetical protein